MSKQIIIIYASELAACIGKNPFRDTLKSIQLTFQRNHGQTTTEKPVEILEKIDESLLHQFETDMDTDQVVSNTETNKNIIDTFDISDNEKTILCEYMKNLHFTGHGTHQEDKIVEQSKLVIKKDNIFRKKLLYTDAEYQVFLGGKCDGLIEDKCLVEIKTRMYKLFNQIKEYEKIQIYAYLYIYDIATAKLVEKYKDETAEHELIFALDEFNTLIKDEIPAFLKIYTKI